VLGLHRDDGSLAKDPIEVKGMFSYYFHNIFSHYAFIYVVVSMCFFPCGPCKVSYGDSDSLDIYSPSTRYLLHCLLRKMVNL
jgi:hypothetical protein